MVTPALHSAVLAAPSFLEKDILSKICGNLAPGELWAGDPLDGHNSQQRLRFFWGFVYIPRQIENDWLIWLRKLFQSQAARLWIAVLEEPLTANSNEHRFLADNTIGYIKILDTLSRKLFSVAIMPWELNSRGEEVLLNGLVGRSASVARVKKLIDKYSRVGSPVVLSGETGTGKEVIAKQIHERSSYSKGPFIAINCSAIPDELFEAEMFGYVAGAFTDAQSDREGWFQKANKGTLFLDEIAELSLRSQAKLLRVLEQKTVTPIGTSQSSSIDVRIVTASHVDLREAVKAKTFREDLYYRLSVLSIEAPPLRVRKEDILLLASYLLRQLSNELNLPVRQICFESLLILASYKWPGNVRELINKLKQACILCDELILTGKHLEFFGLPKISLDQINSVPPLDKTISRAEFKAVSDALRATGDNISAAAELLGISRMTLYRLIRKHDIDL
ncbi:MAG TPA: hypothetical protein DCZ03_01010 [Gammaproteobacteria bacterium]|nr:hypothetical protein [Gammaproteobacteria bacterium]